MATTRIHKRIYSRGMTVAKRPLKNESKLVGRIYELAGGGACCIVVPIGIPLLFQLSRIIEHHR